MSEKSSGDYDHDPVVRLEDIMGLYQISNIKHTIPTKRDGPREERT
jgi:hypothetical protein